MSSRQAYESSYLTGISNLSNERLLSKNYFYSYNYAKNVLKGRFELGEEEISKDCHYSYYYATHVLKARFRIGELVISSFKFKNNYVKDILGYNHE